jgi:hypothetical protein
MEAKLEDRVRSLKEAVLVEVLNKNGRYDAYKLAAYIDWSKQEIATFLGKHPSALSRESASVSDQSALASLAVVVKELLVLLGGDLAIARAWLRTPIRVLDEKSPKERILERRLDTVASLLGEIQSGFAS